MATNQTAIIKQAEDYLRKGDPAASLDRCVDLLAFEPGNIHARRCAALALQMLSRPADALAQLDLALTHHPDAIDVRAHRTALLIELRRFDEAMTACDAILAEVPDQLQALNSLAIALVENNRLGDALGVFSRAFKLAPTNARLLANYGNFLSYTGIHDVAVAAYEAAVALKPQDREIGVNHGMTLLRAGRLDVGWGAFEQRKRLLDPVEESGIPILPVLSEAGDLSDKTILLFHEQGLGDSLQLLRYVPLLAARSRRVLLRMPPELRQIAASAAGCAAVIGPDETPDPMPHYVLPMMSLPRVFATVLDTIPGDTPYLFAEPNAVASWAATISDLPHPRIGLVWAGSPRGGLDHRRSMTFDTLLPLFSLPASFVSLQKGPAGHQWAPMADAALDPTASLHDFADTAALIVNLDLVISVDTSTAHVAGAVGCPVWMLDRFDSCWRWLSGRIDSPWYPQLRLFRQQKPGDWDGTVLAAKDALSRALRDGELGR